MAVESALAALTTRVRPAQTPIEDYGIIGDCRSAALVSTEGSIDWLCWPRFDSPPLFDALLDAGNGGRFSIAPTLPYTVDRTYLPESNVLTTRFTTPFGQVVLTDLMVAVPEDSRNNRLLPSATLIRRVKCLEGWVPLAVHFCVAPSSGGSLTQRAVDNVTVELPRGALAHLASTTALHVQDGEVVSEIIVNAGDHVDFALSFTVGEPAVFPPLSEVDALIEDTDRYWRTWSSACSDDMPYRDAVIRSALAIKLLSYSPSGAIIAAPTTSLPEVPGGDRNWDYRYCWLRDASLTVRALVDLGHEDEARAYTQWLLHATRLNHPRLKVLYDVFGRSPQPEREVSDLPGYGGALPVRFGNLAQDQVQLDIYGEVVDAVSACYGEGELSRDERRFVQDIVRYAANHWSDPDAGIWETRDEPEQFVESKAMCWLAITRGAELVERGLIEGDAAQLRHTAQEIHSAVRLEGVDSGRDVLRRSLRRDGLDASLLRLPAAGFFDANDPFMAGTIDAISDELGDGPLVYRNVGDRERGEGAFVVCSFWLVDCLARQGRLTEAREHFEALLAHANTLGLYSEEIDSRSGAFLGNFPLAFSHVGLINAAATLARAERGDV